MHSSSLYLSKIFGSYRTKHFLRVQREVQAKTQSVVQQSRTHTHTQRVSRVLRTCSLHTRYCCSTCRSDNHNNGCHTDATDCCVNRANPLGENCSATDTLTATPPPTRPAALASRQRYIDAVERTEQVVRGTAVIPSPTRSTRRERGEKIKEDCSMVVDTLHDERLLLVPPPGDDLGRTDGEETPPGDGLGRAYGEETPVVEPVLPVVLNRTSSVPQQ